MAVALKISGPEGERRVNVSGNVKLGRASGCDVVLNHPSVSAEALLVRRDGAGAIADPLGGVVALNEARIQSKRQLKDGDELKLGPYRVKVLVTGSLSVRPPSVRPGDLAPASTRPPLTLPPGTPPISVRLSAPPQFWGAPLAGGAGGPGGASPPPPGCVSPGAPRQSRCDHQRHRLRRLNSPKRSACAS